MCYVRYQTGLFFEPRARKFGIQSKLSFQRTVSHCFGSSTPGSRILLYELRII